MVAPKPDPAVRVTNAACPHCDGPVYFSQQRWLFCPRCGEPKLPGGEVTPRPVPADETGDAR